MKSQKLPVTERALKESENLEDYSLPELFDLMNFQEERSILAVREAKPEIISAIEKIYQKVKAGGRVFYLGAGTSGRMGVMDAAECPPTFGVPEKLFQGIIAGGEPAFFRAVEGEEDKAESALLELEKRNFNSGDCLVGITAGGRTPFVRAALKYAGELGALSILITANPESDLKKFAQVAIVLETGPEVLTGSTRLKAATATKMVLNMISTIVMVRMGLSYKGKMISLRTGSQKLLERGIGILEKEGKISREQALDYLKQANGELKTAFLMAKLKISNREAIKLLKNNQGNLPAVLDRFK